MCIKNTIPNTKFLITHLRISKLNITQREHKIFYYQILAVSMKVSLLVFSQSHFLCHTIYWTDQLSTYSQIKFSHFLEITSLFRQVLCTFFVLSHGVSEVLKYSPLLSRGHGECGLGGRIEELADSFHLFHRKTVIPHFVLTSLSI